MRCDCTPAGSEGLTNQITSTCWQQWSKLHNESIHKACLSRVSYGVIHTCLIFIPAEVNCFTHRQSKRAVKHMSDHELQQLLRDQSQGCYDSQYVMVRNDTMAAAGLLANADYARGRRERVLFSGIRWWFKFMLRAGLAECQHSFMEEAVNSAEVQLLISVFSSKHKTKAHPGNEHWCSLKLQQKIIKTHFHRIL